MLLWLILIATVVLLLRPRLAALRPERRRQLRWFALGLVLIAALLYARQPGPAALLAGLLALLPWLLRLATRVHLLTRALGIDWQGQVSRSVLRSTHIELELDAATGALQGGVRVGPYASRRLASLSAEELTLLRAELEREDLKGRYLLDAWLWYQRGQRPAAEAPPPPRSGRMPREEALAVLGLGAGVDRDAIVQAHRRLVQRLHPDRGGSDYLASLLNEARSVLLDDSG